MSEKVHTPKNGDTRILTDGTVEKFMYGTWHKTRKIKREKYY